MGEEARPLPKKPTGTEALSCIHVSNLKVCRTPDPRKAIYRKSISLHVTCRKVLHESCSRLLDAFPFRFGFNTGFGLYLLFLIRLSVLLEVVAALACLVS